VIRSGQFPTNKPDQLVPFRHFRGLKLVVSDAHEGIKAYVAKVLNASWQRRRVHFMRNTPAHARKAAGACLRL
jgi:transposase-like protein